MEQIITGWILPLLFYSGPLFTYGAVARLYSTPGRVRFFKWSVIIHAFAFMPFVFFIVIGNKDALHSLILPAVTGFLLFISGAIYLLFVSIKTK
jgi:hypothetical protein